MKWRVGNRLVLAGFGIATAILVFVGWQSYRNTGRFAEAAQWREHTYEVLNSLDTAVARLSDAETGQRGYLLTGEEAYLEPYRAAIKSIDQTIGELKSLTSDNPNQQKRIQILEPLVEKKLAELQMTIELRKNEGLAAANRVVLEGSGKQSMDQIRAIIAEMANEEKDLLRVRTQETNESAVRSVRAILIGTLLSISLLVLCFGLLLRELSERKKAQAALVKSEKWFSTTLASIGDAVIATDMNGGVTFMNSVAQSLTGWSQADATGKSMDLVFDIVNRETRRPVENPVKKVFRGGKVVGLADHTILLSKDGKEFDIEDSAAPILTDTGEGFGVVLVFRDITEKKLADEETKRQKELQQLILESIAEGVVVADSNGKFLLFNAAAEQFLGFGATDAAPNDWSDRYGTYLPDTRIKYPPEELPLVRAMRGENVDAAEVFIRNGKVPDGRLLSITGRPLRSEDGALQGGVVVFHDVTLQKRAQEVLVRAKEEAERTSKFKDQFLSTMSHELRTPLNAVLGFSDLLADERYGSLNDRQRRYVTHIHTGGTHLLRLITDILDLSKIEAGRMEIVRENVSVASAFAEVLSALQPLAEKKSQTLFQQVEPNLYVRADGTRFKQILMNLIGNAIKFTPEGGRIQLIARKAEEQVRLEVRDNGPGIPPGQQQQIFEAFFRVAETGNATEGTGLGLAITARLVELHGSKLEIESRPGQGTCFYFFLPLLAIAPDEPAQTTIAAPRAGKAPRILVVEDNAATGQLIQSQLTSSGYDTLRCDQPERATEMAAEHQPDAITLDLLMQPVHGLEVLLQLKNDPRTSKIPVIIVTIVDQPGVGTALGADEYLVKPVDKATLLAAVERSLKSRGGAAPARAILVVEDDASTREMIEELLTARGYSVITAADGAHARTHVAHALPELVILDLVLPKMSGFELLAEWRGNPRTADLPVFVLTSKDLTKEEER
ncbi:MAG TPA: CHASE3 domain-containing protein, partial [Candidatus Acidoferrum sp.]|nr:CHASE3 domain-containing protein [Candidatus Acidoferrum sp.]